MTTTMQEIITDATIKAFNQGLVAGRREGYSEEQIKHAINQAKLHNEVGEYVYTQDFWEFLDER